MKSNAEKPECLSIIICDDVYRDETTKKLIIVGAFNTVRAPSFPCKHPRMVVLFTLTNARGEYDLSLRVEHERTGHGVIDISGPFKLQDPLAIVDINVELRDLVFPETGKYWVVLMADKEIICQRPFSVELWNETQTDT